MDFKANIVKLDRQIIYQPIFISDRLYYNILNKFGNNSVEVDGFRVYLMGDPELDFNYLFLGTSNMKLKESKGDRYALAYKFFSNNKSRDEYYNRLIKILEKTIKIIKEK